MSPNNPQGPPENPDQMHGALEPNVSYAIAIASGKGGVGKSTVAVNVAVALAQQGARVGLLDADIYGPNIPTMMGVHDLPPRADERWVPAQVHGVKIISVGFLVGPEDALIWRGPILHKLIRDFIGQVEWGDLDYLIIDLPPGTGDAGLSLAQSIRLAGGVIVTLPQQVSLDDARRGLDMFRRLNVDVLGVVENMSYLELPDGQKLDIFGSGGGKQLAEETGVPFIGSIPMDPAVRVSGDSGQPVLLSDPDSKAASAFRYVAAFITERVQKSGGGSEGQISIEFVG